MISFKRESIPAASHENQTLERIGITNLWNAFGNSKSHKTWGPAKTHICIHLYSFTSIYRLSPSRTKGGAKRVNRYFSTPLCPRQNIRIHPLTRSDIVRVFINRLLAFGMPNYCLRTCQTPWQSACGRVLLPCEHLTLSFRKSKIKRTTNTRVKLSRDVSLAMLLINEN